MGETTIRTEKTAIFFDEREARSTGPVAVIGRVHVGIISTRGEACLMNRSLDVPSATAVAEWLAEILHVPFDGEPQGFDLEAAGGLKSHTWTNLPAPGSNGGAQ